MMNSEKFWSGLGFFAKVVSEEFILTKKFKTIFIELFILRYYLNLLLLKIADFIDFNFFRLYDTEALNNLIIQKQFK